MLLLFWGANKGEQQEKGESKKKKRYHFTIDANK